LQISNRILTDSYSFLTEEIMGGQNYNFVSKFFKREFLSSIFCIFGRKCSDKKILAIFWKPKI